MKLGIDRIDSPIGTILVASSADGVCALDFDDCRARMETLLARRFGTIETVPATDPFGVATALAAYFDGRLDALDTVALDLAGTEFQMSVWARLRRIPASTTISYAELAAAIGRPSAIRAVGSANGKNPVALIVPCHRVVRSGGALGGYAGGLDRKRRLLAHESGARRVPAAGTTGVVP